MNIKTNYLTDQVEKKPKFTSKKKTHIHMNIKTCYITQFPSGN